MNDDEPMLFDSSDSPLRCDLCGSAGTLEIVDLGNGVCCFPSCPGDPDEWYAAEVERLKDQAPA